MNKPLTITKELEFQLGNIKRILESYSASTTKIIVSNIEVVNSDELNIYGLVRVKFLTESKTAIRHQKIICQEFKYDKLGDNLYIRNSNSKTIFIKLKSR